MEQQNRISGDIGWFALLMALLLLSLGAAWHSLASMNYGFAMWYDVLDIGEHIDHYGPQNRYKQGLEALSRQQHEGLFADIVAAVHNHGQGLSDISYTVIYGDQSSEDSLLRQPEVIHLQDVANLIDWLNQALLFLLPIALLLMLWLTRQKMPLRWKRQLGVLSVVVGGGALAVMLIGPKAVFYQLHVWIFPDEHQWFFYYQESLMTTLMHAPQLFGLIAAAIAVFGLLLFTLALLVVSRWLRTQAGS